MSDRVRDLARARDIGVEGGDNVWLFRFRPSTSRDRRLKRRRELRDLLSVGQRPFLNLERVVTMVGRSEGVVE
jgi:hypothetical protein